MANKSKNALLIGTNARTFGLFGHELHKAGYDLTAAPSKWLEEKTYRVEIGGENHPVTLKYVTHDLKNLDKILLETGLVVVDVPKPDLTEVGSTLAHALYNGYCRIERHQRHTLNVLVSCDRTYRPAQDLHESIKKTWLNLPGGRHLVQLGVKHFRVTNTIGKRECFDKDDYIQASPEFTWEIEKSASFRMLDEELIAVDTREELERLRNRQTLIKSDLFLGNLDMRGISYIDNISYNQKFPRELFEEV